MNMYFDFDHMTCAVFLYFSSSIYNNYDNISFNCKNANRTYIIITSVMQSINGASLKEHWAAQHCLHGSNSSTI